MIPNITKIDPETLNPIERFRALEKRVSLLESPVDPFVLAGGNKSTTGQAPPDQTVPPIVKDPRLHVTRVLVGPNSGRVIIPSGWWSSGSFAWSPDLLFYFNVDTDVDMNGYVNVHPFSDLHK